MAIESEINRAISPIIRTFDSKLIANLEGEMTRIYLSGDAQMVAWGKTASGLPLLFEGPATAEAVAYARAHCATLVTEMGKETQRRIANIIANNIAHKGGIQGITSELRNTFKLMKQGDGMSVSRARMIARTETNNALSQSFLDRGTSMGVEYKEWVVFAPCALCAVNAGVVIPMNAQFPSGHYRPTVHPHCNCALAPALRPKRGKA